MTDKQIIGGRGSAKSYTTLNTIEVMLENEKLKETLKAKEQECEELKETFDGLLKVQYKLALTEIKEIAEVLITTTDEYDSCYYKDRCSKCEVKEDCQYFKVEQILQKISEVIPNEN